MKNRRNKMWNSIYSKWEKKLEKNPKDKRAYQKALQTILRIELINKKHNYLLRFTNFKKYITNCWYIKNMKRLIKKM